MKTPGLILLTLCLAQQPAFAMKPMPDGEVRDLIISGEISEFQNQGGECPCPYTKDTKQNQNLCGERSAYIQQEGSIKCYHGDISDKQVKEYRQIYGIPKPAAPWSIERKEGS